MIVPMKHLTLLCVAPEGEKALESLRELGCVHLDLSAAASPEFAEAKGELADAERAVRILDKAAKDFKVIKESKEIKVVNAPNDSKDLNNLKDLNDPNDPNDLKDLKDSNDPKDLKDVKDLKSSPTSLSPTFHPLNSSTF